MKHSLMICLSAALLFALSACNSRSDHSAVMVTPLPASAQAAAQETDHTPQPAGSPAAPEESGSKTLIAYFSLVDIVPEGADASAHATPQIGNTESAALEIQAQTGGDLFAIKTVQTYPVDHRECSALAEEEMRTDARPELASHVENMADYDTIYLGYPIWWYQEPMAIRTFLEEYDLSGKTILPFCTSLGAGIAESEAHIRALCPDSTVRDGLTLRTGQSSVSASVAEWLAELGITE